MEQNSFSNADNFYVPPPPPAPAGPYGTISMVLGIVSLALLSCCGPLSFVLAIVGIVMACMTRAGGAAMDSRAKAGMICSIITLAISVLMLFFFVFVIVIVSLQPEAAMLLLL